jgi:hypothetical protein
MNRHLCLAIACLMAAPASAVTLDGSIAGDGYTLAATQKVETNFGDGNPDGGSELDAAWGQVSGGVLYVTLTGNLENNFNKLNVFIDSVAGGENVVTTDTGNGGNNPSNDGWASKYAGFTFDSGFAADYLLILRNGNFGGDRFDVDFNSVGNTSVLEQSASIFGASLTGSNASVGASGLGIAFDRSNTAGVGGGTGTANAAAAQAVQTGIELAIPLAAIGNPGLGDVVKLSAMINGSNHDFLSNQFLGGLPGGQGNLGGDGAGNFNGTVGQINLETGAYAPDAQFFSITIVPEPASLALIGLSLVGLACGRARRG